MKTIESNEASQTRAASKTKAKRVTQAKQPRSFSEAFINTICQRLSEGKRVRRALPRWGRLHIDRQLPFLCVYRLPAEGEDPGTSVPEFHYRPLPMDPSLLKRQLFKIPLERIEDPTLAHLFLDQQMELDRSNRSDPPSGIGSFTKRDIVTC